MVTGFHHTGIVVQDIDRMVEFYTRELGLNVLRRILSVAPPEGNHTGIPGARRTLVFVGFEGDHQIELVHYIDPPAREGYLDKHQFGATHVCFRVADLRETYGRLRARGVRFETAPKFQEADGKTIGVIYARDPEGNWLEFIEGD